MKITKILDDNYKEVDYYNIKLRIPIDCNYLAVNKDGTIFAYHYKPYGCIGSIWISSTETFAYICKVEYEGNWKESLIKLD